MAWMNARFWASLSCRAASACPAGLLDFEAIQRKGQRVADPLQEIQFRFGERARRVDVEIQGAEHRAVQAEGYGGERPIAALEHFASPRRALEGRVGIVARHDLVPENGLADGALAEGAGRVDVDVDRFQIALFVAGMGDRLQLARRGLFDQPDPRQAEASELDGDAADFAQQFVAFLEVHHGLVDLGEDDVEMAEELLGPLVRGDVAQHDAARRTIRSAGRGQMGPEQGPVFFPIRNSHACGAPDSESARRNRS